MTKGQENKGDVNGGRQVIHITGRLLDLHFLSGDRILTPTKFLLEAINAGIGVLTCDVTQVHRKESGDKRIPGQPGRPEDALLQNKLAEQHSE